MSQEFKNYGFCHNAGPDEAGEFFILGLPDSAEDWFDDADGFMHFMVNSKGEVRQIAGVYHQLTDEERQHLYYEVRQCFPQVGVVTVI